MIRPTQQQRKTLTNGSGGGSHDNNKYHRKRRGNTTTNKCLLLVIGVGCLATFCFVPIWLLERSHVLKSRSVVTMEQQFEHAVQDAENQLRGALEGDPIIEDQKQQQQQQQQQQPDELAAAHDDGHQRTTKDGRVLPALTMADLDTTLDAHCPDRPVARGVAGAALSETPALQGAVRAHIDCDVNVDTLAYWNDYPVGAADENFVSPFAESVGNSNGHSKYITFAPDRGGWNNVRMSMEIIFVIAAATGRTLVLPPREPLYLLHLDAAARHRGFADFFPIHSAAFQKRVQVISFAEFLEREKDGPLAPPTDDLRKRVAAAADNCDKRDKSDNACGPVFEYLKTAGYSAPVSAVNSCFVFDEHKYKGQDVPADVQEHLDTVCGPKRDQVFWDQEMQQHPLIHFRASEKNFRLLTHFYNMIHFTDPALDNHYKRFVRDFLHYHDSIYCAAGKIVKAVQHEGVSRGFVVDADGAGGYSALHVRRGDLQYKKVKISAQEWYDNTKEVWKPNEILYVATDERDKSFFDDLARHHDLRFLDDYWDLAGLGDLDPNYMGMIDTIVASRGRAFAGTWFSTFSGYIARLRGYHGMSMMDTWYSFLPKKTAMHEWNLVDDFAYAYEWPDGWVGIDRDTWPSRDKF